MRRIITPLLAALLVVGCNDSQPAKPATAITVSAESVTLVQCSLKAGKASDASLRAGLQAAARVLAELYVTTSKTHSNVMGHFRGTLHVEPDGTVRMFAESGSDISPAGAAGITDDFIGATFGKKWQFPKLGQDCLIAVDFQLGKKD